MDVRQINPDGSGDQILVEEPKGAIIALDYDPVENKVISVSFQLKRGFKIWINLAYVTKRGHQMWWHMQLTFKGFIDTYWHLVDKRCNDTCSDQQFKDFENIFILIGN